MNSKTIRTVKTILSVLWWIAVILIAVLMVNIIGAKLKGRVPSIFGYSVINIVTGSMDTGASEDDIPVGSYILIKKTSAEKIKKGDVICFYSDDPAIYGLPNTHRVVEDPIKTESGIEFVTRGDANPENDPYNARGEALVGVYVKRLDGLMKFSKGLEGGGMLAIIIAMQVGIFGIAAYSMVVKARNSDGDENAENDGKENKT